MKNCNITIKKHTNGYRAFTIFSAVLNVYEPEHKEKKWHTEYQEKELAEEKVIREAHEAGIIPFATEAEAEAHGYRVNIMAFSSCTKREVYEFTATEEKFTHGGETFAIYSETEEELYVSEKWRSTPEAEAVFMKWLNTRTHFFFKTAGEFEEARKTGDSGEIFDLTKHEERARA